MDIVRSTLENDGHLELVEMVDNNDTRVAHLFGRYKIAFSEDVVKLLSIEMALKFKKDYELIIKSHPDSKDIFDSIAKNLSDKDADFSEDILNSLLDLNFKLKGELREEIERCTRYYTSHYLDLPEFDPYELEKEENISSSSSSTDSTTSSDATKIDDDKTEKSETD